MTQDKGHYRAYKKRRFGEEAMRLLGIANAIIAEYEQQGLTMTLRQLYYQCVARDIFPNRAESYNQLKGLISEGRMAGLVSWLAIEDRTRNLQGLSHNRSPAQAIRHARNAYRLDLWKDQQWRPEIWVEKEALAGVVGDIANKLRVDYFAVRGYNSQSEQWRAGQRFADYIRRGQRPIVFHLGDHDPSGIDMTRDNQERLSLFAGTPIIVQRLALNYTQIEELRPPPNPVKMKDARSGEYRARFGDSSWELDALSPVQLRELISDAVLRIRDHDRWDQSLLREQQDIAVMDSIIEELGE